VFFSAMPPNGEDHEDREGPATLAWAAGPAAVARAAHWVMRGAGANVPFDDLVSAGHEALVRSEREFDTSRGVPLPAYARIRIRRAMLELVRREGRFSARTRTAIHAAEVSDEVLEAIAEDEEHRHDRQLWARTCATSATLAIVHGADFGGDPAERLDRARLKERVRAIMESRSPQALRLFTLVYEEGLSLQEAANELGLSISRVSRLHAREIAHVAQEIGAPGGARASGPWE
jgi:RNA polymerase sigma factor for flagellar operon FliA